MRGAAALASIFHILANEFSSKVNRALMAKIVLPSGVWDVVLIACLSRNE
jgi:hypothetical protein